MFPSYPEWVSDFRDEQLIATERICRAFNQGVRLVLLDGPTGVGKSLIPEMVRRQMMFESSLYVCSGLELQTQVGEDFPYMVDVRGRDNYPTELFRQEFNQRGLDRISCADCTYFKDKGCKFCSGIDHCPYQKAVWEGVMAEQTLMNSSYFLTEANHVGRFSGRDFVCIDEADLLDQQMMNLIEIRIPRKVQRMLSIHAPRYSTKVEAWESWYQDAMLKLGIYLEQTNRRDLTEPDEVKSYNRCRSLWMQLRDAGGLDDLWTYVGKDDDEVAFRPVEPGPWGMPKLFNHGQRFLLMSATLLSGDMMADQLGWDVGEPYEVIYLPSPFPPENRPIRFAPLADMGFTNRKEELPRLIAGCAAVLEQHVGQRVVIHTKTYDTSRALENIRPGHTYAYLNKWDRHKTLERFKRDREGVLVASSMERGLDLPDDLCRAIIICQLPFPYEGDRQIKKRIYGTGLKGKRWRLMETMRSLVQMSGRGVRHDSDTATTWVLDSRAPGFVDNCRRQGIAPKWWTDAIENGPWLRVLGMERKG